MRGLTLSIVSLVSPVWFACAAPSAPEPGEEASELGDEIDDAVKADGRTAPGGLYLLDASSLIEDEFPQFSELDLRSDKSYYRTFGMLSPDDYEGNYSMGWSFDRGSFKFSSNRATGKTYLRFYDEAGRLDDVWRYTLDGARLVLHYRTDGGFVMDPQAPADKAWVTDVVAQVEPRIAAGTLEGLTNVGIYANGFPQPARNAALELGTRGADRIDPAPTYRVRSGGKSAYVVANSSRVEIYASNGQLIAAGEIDAGAVDWTDL